MENQYLTKYEWRMLIWNIIFITLDPDETLGGKTGGDPAWLSPLVSCPELGKLGLGKTLSDTVMSLGASEVGWL